MPAFAPHPERRVAVVTGASSGIGAAVVRELTLAGHPVVLGARRVQRCEELVESLRAEVGDSLEAVSFALDVADNSSVLDFARRATQWAGEVDIVVSNAGGMDPVAGLGDPARFRSQVELNLLGPQALAAAFGPAMVERGHGDLVFVTSESAVIPRPMAAGYVAAKAGVEALVRTMRIELEGTGVRAGLVRPGPTATEQGSTWDAAIVEHVVETWQRFALIRHDGYMRPRDVAAAVMAMVSTARGSEVALIEIQPQAPTGQRVVRDNPAQQRVVPDNPAQQLVVRDNPKQH